MKSKKLKKNVIITPLIFVLLFTYIVISAQINGHIKIFDNSRLVNKVEDLLGARKVYASNSNGAIRKEDLKVHLGGTPLGIKLKTKGVLVVGLSEVEARGGEEISPGALSGIQIGDSILEVDGKEIKSAEDLSEIINVTKDKELRILVDHKNEVSEKILKPILSSKDNKYKIGLWVRDSTTGIGTLSFYEENSNTYGALGHAITDVDTGNIMSVREGNIVNSNIVSVKPGEKGIPGELKGIFIDENKDLGNIHSNTECGIFGDAEKYIMNSVGEEIEIAFKEEIKLGEAEIVTTIEGKKPERYKVQIEKLLKQEESNSKSMVIKITDPRLLDKTGGIVQGMSGSPIIQDGKLIGAVTHVLVNKPDVGYGVYIEWMLKEGKVTK